MYETLTKTHILISEQLGRSDDARDAYTRSLRIAPTVKVVRHWRWSPVYLPEVIAAHPIPLTADDAK